MRVFLFLVVYNLSIQTIEAEIIQWTKMDTVEAYQNSVMGDSLLKTGSYDKSILYLKSALDGYEKNKAWSSLVKSLNKLSEALWRFGKYKEGLAVAEKALLVSKEHHLEEINLAISYNNIAIIHGFRRDYNESLEMFHKVLEINFRNYGKNHKKVAVTYNNIGVIYEEIGQYDKASVYYKKSLKIGKETLGEDHLDLALQYNNLGTLNNKKGDYTTALLYHKKGLDIYRENLASDHPYIASSLSNIAIIFSQKDNQDKALIYFKEAMRINEKKFGENHYKIIRASNNVGAVYEILNEDKYAMEFYQKSLRILNSLSDTLITNGYDAAITYSNLGVLYQKNKQWDTALEYFKKALAIDLKDLGSNHPDVADSYDNIGIVFRESLKFNEAINYHNKARSIYENNFGKSHPETARALFNLGLVYDKMKNSELALLNFQRALKSLKTSLGDNHSKVAEYFNEIASFYKKQKLYDSTLANLQNALIANSTSSIEISKLTDVRIQDIIDSYIFLESLELKAKTFNLLPSEDPTYQQTALSIYRLCDRLIKQIRQSHLRYEDKVTFGKIALDIYTEAIQTCSQLYSFTNDSKYAQEAFYYTEQAKASVLSENLSNQKAKKFSSLPDSLLQLEQSLKIDISFYQSQINKMSTGREGYDSVRLDVYEDQLFALNRSLDSLKESLEKNHPDYYNLKYKNNTLSIKQIQKELTSNQAILEYFEGDSTLYTFCITRNRFELFNTPLDSTFLAVSNNFISGFRQLQPPNNYFKDFKSNAQALYKLLIKRPLSTLHNKINSLVIVPTSKLSIVPWDLLISDDKGDDYRSLNYVLKKYAISYTHSASILFGDKHDSKGYSKTVLAFAPSYPMNEPNYTLADLDQALRNQLVPLKWNQPEALAISQLFEGNTIIGSQATEKKFKVEASKHQILHLAMHALVDHEESMQSKLIFTQDGDSIEDGMLHAYELFNMNISAELVVLSACNTGLGKLEEGEGVMSLARAFSYAGCPSVVMSHWSVNDQATAKLMASFYQYLSEGDSKDQALQKAKLDFLNGANDIQVNPFYWASFVVLGDTKPLNKGSNLSVVLACAIGILLLLSIYTIYRKNNPNPAPSKES